MSLKAWLLQSPLPFSVTVFLLATVLLTVFGVAMTRVAKQLSDRTGMGEAITGALFLGGCTSLAEIVTCSTAALEGHANLAVSNAVGSIAGQTAFLAVADMAYRKANLEHAAASVENLMLCAFLMTLLGIPIVAMAYPDMGFWQVHPASMAIVVAYVFGMRLLAKTVKRPMWLPRRTRETHETQIHDNNGTGRSLAAIWLYFLLTAVVVGIAGWLLAESAIAIVKKTGLTETAVGTIFTGLASSLPELITAVTAVRMGALTLAVGDVLGGNAFDTLMVAVSDFAYRPGPIYADLSHQVLFLMALTIVLTGILLMRMLHREKHGFANIGLESTLVLIGYLAAVVLFLSA